MDNTIIAALIGVGGVLLGTWIGGIIARKASKEAVESSNQNAIRVMKRQEFAKAAATFRNEFLALMLVLKGINDPPNDDTPGAFVSYLHSLYSKHAAAVITFTPYLNKSGVECLNQAWFNYKFPNGIKKGTEEEKKEAFPLDDYAHMPEPRKMALEKIERLLSACDHDF